MQTLTLKRQIHFASDRSFSTTTFRDLVFSCRSLWSQQWRVIWFKKQTPIVRVTSEQLRYTEQASACSATVTYGSSHSTFTLSHVSNVNDDHESHLKTRSITSDPNLIVQVILISTCEIRIHCYESLFFPRVPGTVSTASSINTCTSSVQSGHIYVLLLNTPQYIMKLFLPHFLIITENIHPCKPHSCAIIGACCWSSLLLREIVTRWKLFSTSTHGCQKKN